MMEVVGTVVVLVAQIIFWFFVGKAIGNRL